MRYTALRPTAHFSPILISFSLFLLGCRSMSNTPGAAQANALSAAAVKLGGKTASGISLPSGWALKQSDHFGTSAGNTITNFSSLHAHYFEGQFYNRDSSGRVLIPNIVINAEQQTYGHFEDVISFSGDHLTIQARGHADQSISSGELVSVVTSRSFCVEARYKIPSTAHAWPAFWQYGSTAGNDVSELDFEQPIAEYQGVHDVTLHNHPTEGVNFQIFTAVFTTQYMNFNSSTFDASAQAHYYTSCYDDQNSQIARYIDGSLLYTANFQWNASLGGTGRGPNATTILNLAVGGGWPGYVSDPTVFSADMDIYSVEYYSP